MGDIVTQSGRHPGGAFKRSGCDFYYLLNSTKTRQGGDFVVDEFGNPDIDDKKLYLRTLKKNNSVF